MNRLGAIEIVDLGTHDQKKLYDELADQRALAHANGQTLLLMTTRFGSELFRDFDTALADPRVQAALAGVRLVRAELHYFTPELEELGIPTDSYPWFFLLRGDLVPRDGISGGEWDEDVPQNIAPVLEAFVKGTLTTRRQKWTPPRSNDIQL